MAAIPLPHQEPEVMHLNLFTRLCRPCNMAMPQAVAGAGKIPRQYPVEDFFRNPRRGFFQLSDDGSMLGFMEPVSIDGGPARMNVFVQALQGSALVGSARRLTSETERDVSGFFWKGNRTVLFEKDFNGDENFHVLAVDAETATEIGRASCRERVCQYV